MDQLLNLFGQMMRMPLDMMAAGVAWFSQMGQEPQPQASTSRPANGSPYRLANPGQPANASAAAEAWLSQMGQGLQDCKLGAGAGVAPSKEGGLQVLVIFELFQIVDPKQLQQAVTETHCQLSRIFASGTVVASGAFAVGRGGFFLLNVGSCEELLLLMAPGLNDNCTFKMWPILPFAQQLAVFQELERTGSFKL